MRGSHVFGVVAVLTAVGAAIRFGSLDSQSFWLDELVTVSLLHRSFEDMLSTIPDSEATPYLYYVLAWPWARVFGFGEVGLRSLSALVGTATIPLAYAAGAASVSRRAGVIAAALVTVNPFLVWYAQEARSYSLLVFLGASSVLLFAYALGARRLALAGWALSASLALATHYFALFLIVPEVVWMLARLRPRRPVIVATLAPAVVLAAHTPLLLEQRGAGEAVRESRLLSRIAGVPKNLVVGYSFPWEIAGSVAAVALVAVGLVLVVTGASARSRRGALVAGSLAAFTLVVPMTLAVLGADFLIVRNLIAAVVPAAICVAAGYAANRVGIAAAAMLCALWLAIDIAVSVDAGYGRTDWRGAAAEVGAPGVERAIVVTPFMSRTLWSPYLPGLGEPRGEETVVQEIVVLGLATEGGFSSGPVHPPTGAPPPPPEGFEMVELVRTQTLALARYRAPSPTSVPNAALAALTFTSVQPGVLVQRSSAG